MYRKKLSFRNMLGGSVDVEKGVKPTEMAFGVHYVSAAEAPVGPPNGSSGARRGAIEVSADQIRLLMEMKSAESVPYIEKNFQSTENLCIMLGSHPEEGILDSPADTAKRVSLFGQNEVPKPPPVTVLQLILRAMKDTTLIILMVAALVSLALSFYHGSPNPDEEQTEENDPTAWIDGVAILVSVMVVVLVTAFNDWSKEKQFRGLSERVAGERVATVIRGGTERRLPTTDLVVGDVCQIQYGDQLSADGVLLRGNDLKMDESTLTGEPDLVAKTPIGNPLLFSGTSVMEGRGLMLVTAVGPNSQSGIIMSLLNSAGSENGGDSKSVLQKKLATLAMQIGYAGSAAAVVTVLVLCIRFSVATYSGPNQRPFRVSDLSHFLNYFIMGVTVLVVAVPEGLPLAVTIALAYSVKKMLKDKNLVRHLDACETMGNATTICSDKTGTLTTNRMTAVTAYIAGVYYSSPPVLGVLSPQLAHLLGEAVSINSNYASRVVPADQPGELPKQLGNKTECALLGLVNAIGLSWEDLRLQRPETSFRKVVTFNSARKSMSTVVPLEGGGYRVYTKGASEVVSAKCSQKLQPDGSVAPHTDGDQIRLVAGVIDKMASQGLRTIGVAYKDIYSQGKKKAESRSLKVNNNEDTISNCDDYMLNLDELDDEEQVEAVSAVKGAAQNDDNNNKDGSEDIDFDDEDWLVSDLTLLAVVGVEDPVRPEVPAAIRQCQSAGVVVRMVTGDNIGTATSIATKCGILGPKQGGLVLDSKEFNRMIRDDKGEVQQELLDLVWPRLRVLARSSPQDKHTLVKGIIQSKLAKGREVVAVTGDGTNDGPALKLADVGFAMGITGTDVAKEACDIVLTDDNFTSIVKAVMWGRNVYDSIAKFLQFQLTVNVVAVTVAFISVCVISDTPLKAVQMLWVNLIMDTLASLALSTESPTPALLKRAPYGRTKPLLSGVMIKNLMGQAIFMIAVIFTLLFEGQYLLDIDSGLHADLSDPPTQHFTFVFNTFVLMILFNEINARKVHGEVNVFTGVLRNQMFCILWLLVFAGQVIIVQIGGHAFSTTALTLDQWVWSVLLGFLPLPWQLVLIAVTRRISWLNDEKPSKTSSSQVEEQNDYDTALQKKLTTQINWVNCITSLNVQMRVIQAFRAGSIGTSGEAARPTNQPYGSRVQYPTEAIKPQLYHP